MDQSFSTLPGKLNSAEALAAHRAALLARDPRLVPIARRAGPFELRTAPAGWPGLARIVCGQQLSIASAGAIWGRFAALPGALTSEGYAALSEAEVRGAGFSAAKHRTLHAVAEAIAAGALDLEAVEGLPAEAAVAALTAVRGIGPWTAELYLMFCAGHPDIFPVGDLALRKAVGHGFGLGDDPAPADVASLAADWAPHRATAALLFWRYYAALRHKEAVPV